MLQHSQKDQEKVMQEWLSYLVLEIIRDLKSSMCKPVRNLLPLRTWVRTVNPVQVRAICGLLTQAVFPLLIGPFTPETLPSVRVAPGQWK